MKKRILKIIVAIWSIFISVDEVILFVAKGDWSDWSLTGFPYVAVALLAIGVLILLPRLEKLDRFLLVVAVLMFGYFAVMGGINLVKLILDTSINDLITVELFRSVSSLLKTIFFYLIPAVLGIMYLSNK